MNQTISPLVGLTILILSVAVIALWTWVQHERSKRRETQALLNQAVSSLSGLQTRYDEIVTDNLHRSRAIEDATLRRQGIPLSGEKPEDKKPREHRAVGASARLAKYYNDRQPVVEAPRTVGPDKAN